MDYLVRIRLNKLHTIAHYVHEIDGVTGALCSQQPKPAVGDRTQGGEWELVDALPKGVRVCLVCQQRKEKIDNPLPARMEKELEKLALWDPKAAAFQREKMLAHYRKEQMSG
jgi:hypothetical protein